MLQKFYLVEHWFFDKEGFLRSIPVSIHNSKDLAKATAAEFCDSYLSTYLLDSEVGNHLSDLKNLNKDIKLVYNHKDVQNSHFVTYTRQLSSEFEV